MSECRAVEAGKDQPVLMPHVVLDALNEIAEERKVPGLQECGFARLLHVSCSSEHSRSDKGQHLNRPNKIRPTSKQPRIFLIAV